MKLRSKILFYTLPLILLPLIGLATANYYFVIRANQIERREEKARAFSQIISGVRHEVDQTGKDVQLLANLSSVASYLKAEIENSNQTDNFKLQAKEAIKFFFDQNPFYLKLSLVDKSGTERIGFSRLQDEENSRSVKSEDFFRRGLSLHNRGYYYQAPIRIADGDRYVSIFVAQVADSKDFLGFMILTLDTAVFESGLKSLARKKLTVFLFDDQGQLFAGLSDELKIPGLTESELAEAASDILAEETLGEDERMFPLDTNSLNFSVKPAYFFPPHPMLEAEKGSRWFFGILEEDPTGWKGNSFLFVFLGVTALAVGVMYLAADAFAKRLTNPIEKVSFATTRIARGDPIADLDIRSGDEIEDLALAVKRMNADLKSYQGQLVQSAKLATMGEMTARISHEIQNRVSGISLWVQYLDSELKESDPMHDYLDEMKQGLKGFTDLLANLKSYYRTPVLEKSKVDINRVVEKSLPFVKENLESKNAEIDISLSASIPKIEADEEKLVSVVSNLLINAIDAVDENGRISVTTDYTYPERPSEAVIKVSDNGAGIEEEDLPQIFYPFFSTKTSGSGLGLAIASNIVGAHEGKIDVESEVGSGTTFTVSLPAV